MMINFKPKLYSLITNVIILFFILLATFGRTFSGVYLYSFRLGEIVTLVGLLVFIYTFFENISKYFKSKQYSSMVLVHTFLVITFVLFIVSDFKNLYNPYVYKSSNYIWTISYIYVGIFIKKYSKLGFVHLTLLNIFLLFSYFISVISYPEAIISFFIENSDKFDFLKAHMHVIFLILVTFLNLKYLKASKINFYYFLILSSIFFPLLIFKSRGAFLGYLIYFCIYIFLNTSFLKKEFLQLFFTVLISIFTFVQSSIYVSGSNLTLQESDQVLSILIENKETYNTFFSFYIENGRLYSEDGNINWRLQIWQDVSNDSYGLNNIITGYGFTDIIPAMTNPSRSGLDGLNENVHNYFINIFARGGLLHLVTILFLYGIIFKSLQLKIPTLKTLALIIPILCVSFFDSSMENPHFPALFYLLIGFIQEKINYNKLNK